MESQPQNPEFRINPENFHPCKGCPNGSQAIEVTLYYRAFGSL